MLKLIFLTTQQKLILVSSNFSKKIFSVMYSALQYFYLRYEFRVFFHDFLLTSFQQKNDIKKGKYLNGIQIFTLSFELMNDLFDVKDG